MSYYPRLDSHKVKVVLDLSNYVTKNGFSSSNLADKSNFVPLKTEFEKLYINKLVDVAIILNNFKTNANDLDVGKLYRLEKIKQCSE